MQTDTSVPDSIARRNAPDRWRQLPTVFQVERRGRCSFFSRRNLKQAIADALNDARRDLPCRSGNRKAAGGQPAAF